MSWLESHQSLGRHLKTIRAARLLGVPVPNVIGHLHLVWYWALDNAENGNLTEYEPAVIADAAMWEGDPEAFVNALVECRAKVGGCGFLERTCDGRLLIHDWDDYTGRLQEIREQNRERQRRFRERRNALRNVTSRVTPVISNAGNAQPNQTEQKAAARENGAAPAWFSALLAKGYTADEIAQAKAKVEARPNPPTNPNWAKYLLPVLEDLRICSSPEASEPPVHYWTPPEELASPVALPKAKRL